MATEQVYDFASLQLASPKSLLFAGFLSFPFNMLKQYLNERRNNKIRFEQFRPSAQASKRVT